MTLFRWLISTGFAILAVFFAVSNMQEVTLYYSPVHPPVSLPLSILVLLGVAFGALFGGAFMWCIHGPLSPKADKKRAQVYGLLKENKVLKEENEIKTQISQPLLEAK